VNNWIETSHELPEPFTPVLVSGKPFSNHPSGVAIGFFDGDSWHQTDEIFGWIVVREDITLGFLELENISHWQPLPQPVAN